MVVKTLEIFKNKHKLDASEREENFQDIRINMGGKGKMKGE